MSNRRITKTTIADMGKQMAIFHPQLQPGQQVVVRGGEGLSDGAAVQAKQEK
ncbi:MAG: hypothetical protein KME60_24870 [Cyanomargarita calcarea GSE-NOS-MK-12-04C]|uniref:Uncharacterized protein n=1 Tax=Cyanomargarita calcarea GSE-NOS-MK-12-04C TaxID=2839659 RepID=A0A951QRW7_9CYAN|nr:hypothetical protein [Cyanomargarita calcarea GSE-NOS-MK-12-04C]